VLVAVVVAAVAGLEFAAVGPVAELAEQEPGLGLE
jgi:hypothetical protein